MNDPASRQEGTLDGKMASREKLQAPCQERKAVMQAEALHPQQEAKIAFG